MTLIGAAGELEVWHCVLRDSQGQVPADAEGLGKGSSRESRVGALFEALEHYLTGRDSFSFAEVDLVDSSDVSANFEGDAAGAIVASLDSRVASQPFTHLGDGSEVWLPLGLYSPWYLESESAVARDAVGDSTNYRDLMRYSCNSGTAIGVSKAEALLHALNESVERDAFSLFLIEQLFMDEPPRPARVVDCDALPPFLRERVFAVEKDLSRQVFLFDVGSGIDVPTVLAYSPAPTALEEHFRGLGASLDWHHAAWRALTELVQASAYLPRVRSKVDTSGLQRFPRLLRCADLDLRPVLARGASVGVPGDAGSYGGRRPYVQLGLVRDRLERAGFQPLSRRAAELATGVYAVQSFVPGLERFSLVCEGNLVTPGPRALRSFREWQHALFRPIWS